MSNKTRNIMLIIYVVALSTLVIGATYAYFTMIHVSHVSPKVDIGTANLNFISFTSGNPIYINPTVDNFKEGMGNLSSKTFASAYLRKEDGSLKSEIKYNLYFEIEKNNLEYSTSRKDAELILKVIDPKGNEVTSIDGLTYVNVSDGLGNQISGFDITTKLGKYYIEDKRSLSTNTEVTEIWNFEVIYVNLSEAQDKNFDKELKGCIKLEREVEENES